MAKTINIDDKTLYEIRSIVKAWQKTSVDNKKFLKEVAKLNQQGTVSDDKYDPVLEGLILAEALSKGKNEGQDLIYFGEFKGEVCNFNGCDGVMIDIDENGNVCSCSFFLTGGDCVCETICSKCGRGIFFD